MRAALQTKGKTPSSIPPTFTPVRSGLLQRKCACGGTPDPTGQCESCRKKRLQRKRSNAGPDRQSDFGLPPIVHEVLRSPGQPLDTGTRAFMEPRFGHDFSQVRVHTDMRAANSAGAVNALAYTVGRNLVFSTGQYRPKSTEGLKLLAHELTHTVQQDNGSEQSISRVSGAGDASEREAVMAAQIITDGRPYRTTGISEVHLARQPMGTDPTPGLNLTSAPTYRETPHGKSSMCGPNATSWFVDQVNAALTNKIVITIKTLLLLAKEKALRKGASSEKMAEAGATAAVQAQEINLGKEKAPVRSGKIKEQMSAGVDSEIATVMFALKDGEALLESGAYIGSAALLWYLLVNHKALYDFKAHADSMNHPKSANCPGDNCKKGEVGIITLCPGNLPQNCYESDLPGNLFYALIGRYVGWSKLTLQLGSQLAELTDKPRKDRPVITWDTPQDTNAIDLGFDLGGVLPLSQSALCNKLPAKRGNLDAREGCEDCLELTPSRIR